MQKNERKNVFFWILFAVLVLYTISMLLLCFWGLSTSLKTSSDFRKNVLWLPSGGLGDWAWDNYPFVLSKFTVSVRRTINGVTKPLEIGMLEQILYTLLYAGVGCIISGIVPCAIAYVVFKFDCVMSKILHTIVLVTLMIPIVGSQASELQMFRSLGLYDTIWGVWILKFNFLGMYFLVFLATFKSLAKEYSEAAYIDGASEWNVMIKIMFPLVKNIIFTVMLIKFIEFWNDYQVPLLYMPSHPTLLFGVWYLGNSSNNLMTEPMRMTSSVIVMFPILILFIIFKNKLIGNLSMGGVKE